MIKIPKIVWKSRSLALLFILLISLLSSVTSGQEQPPEPTAPRRIKVPAISQFKLPNGINVVVVRRDRVPLVSVNLMLKNGAADESTDGLAEMTASLLTKGTRTRSATAIADQMEFLGSGLNSAAGWNSTNVGFVVTGDKLGQALSIMSDVVRNPTFPADELSLYKSQAIDELTVALKQPSRLAAYVAARYSFGEHSVQGTPETITRISQKNIIDYYRKFYRPKFATLIFTGDITEARAKLLAGKYFGSWKNPYERKVAMTKLGRPVYQTNPEMPFVSRMLVIDLPKSGQAAVVYSKKIEVGRESGDFFPASVANSLLGGGYSSRLNQEIRIKRGLSYGAGSGFAWRVDSANFATRCQTKTVSAAEVAELTIAELERLSNETASNGELDPRKNVLNGDFGRLFETNTGISGVINELLTFGLSTGQLNLYMSNTDEVSPQQVKDFALRNLRGGDLIIVGDYNDFREDLAKRFPSQKVEVIRADDLDLNSYNLQKSKSQ